MAKPEQDDNDKNFMWRRCELDSQPSHAVLELFENSLLPLAVTPERSSEPSSIRGKGRWSCCKL
jgi:hypothetical protein